MVFDKTPDQFSDETTEFKDIPKRFYQKDPVRVYPLCMVKKHLIRSWKRQNTVC